MNTTLAQRIGAILGDLQDAERALEVERLIHGIIPQPQNEDSDEEWDPVADETPNMEDHGLDREDEEDISDVEDLEAVDAGDNEADAEGENDIEDEEELLDDILDLLDDIDVDAEPGMDKDAVHSKLVEYHEKIRRPYYAVLSDKVCMDDDWTHSTQFVKHTCSQFTAQTTKKVHAATYLSQKDFAISWVEAEGICASASKLRKLYTRQGLTVSYKEAHRALQNIKKKIFPNLENQYRMLGHYAQLMEAKGHRVYLEIADETHVFRRFAVLYAQGLQSFLHFSERGLQLDGTHLRNSLQGTLLVACFKDSNNKINIIGIAI
ncbi:hypothetical protein HDU96_003157, partial [Phlyctochytrium bullatum]